MTDFRSNKPRAGARPPYRRPAAPAVKTETTGLSLNARRVAAQALGDVNTNGAYASLALQKRLSAARLPFRDSRLCTRIFYTTLENQIKLDFALDRLMERAPSEPELRDILRISACQILFSDRVPDSAAVNEGVKLVREAGMEGAAGFANAVLRNLARQKADIPWPKREDDLREYLHIEYSMPLWIIDRLTDDYGTEMCEQIIGFRPTEHHVTLRPNMLRLNDEGFEQLLTRKGLNWRRGIAPHCFCVPSLGDVTLDADYRSGMYSLQGESSVLAAEAMRVKAGQRVLDCCAAPGGKACYMAEMMQGTGRVFGWDIHEHRVELMRGAQKRLRLENLRLTVRDAREFRSDMVGTLDAVLLDAPCAGLGVLGDKPDLKYRLKPEDIPPIVETQKRLLDVVCRYVKPGGRLVYSTCSILPEENERRIEAFLSEHPDYHIERLPSTFPEEILSKQTAHGLQLFRHRDGIEGFFIASMLRSRA